MARPQAPQDKGFFVLNDILRVSPAEAPLPYLAFAAPPLQDNGVVAQPQVR